MNRLNHLGRVTAYSMLSILIPAIVWQALGSL
jgi:hypothetical protein